MDRYTKYLMIGVALAALILLGGYSTSIYDEYQLSNLVEQCETEAAKSTGSPWHEDQVGILICDPKLLKTIPLENGEGIQKRIVDSLSSSGRTFQKSQIIALYVVILFGLPYAWYFFLRRIRELRDTFAGK